MFFRPLMWWFLENRSLPPFKSRNVFFFLNCPYITMLISLKCQIILYRPYYDWLRFKYLWCTFNWKTWKLLMKVNYTLFISCIQAHSQLYNPTKCDKFLVKFYLFPFKLLENCVDKSAILLYVNFVQIFNKCWKLCW